MQKQLQIEKLKEKIESLAKKYKISYAIIFGSFAEERFVEGESDIDLAIKVKDLKKAEVLNFLKNFLRELEFENVDVTILNFSPFSLQYDALVKGKVIYCENEEELLDDRLKIIKWHEDWLHMYKIFEQREIEKVKK
jgi:predicted nucleotidyltransferase